MSGYQEPFFTRGPSPLARLTFFSLVAIAIMIADHRFQALSWVRLGISVVLNPIEQALGMPATAARRIGNYFTAQTELVTENRALQNRVLELTALGQQARLIQAERLHVDALAVAVDAANRLDSRGIIAEIIRDARNPYARKVILNKGTKDGVTAGVVVIDGDGVVGQVTAVGLLSAEVTLSTEKDQSIPVMVMRDGPGAELGSSSGVGSRVGLRAVAVGNGRDGTIDVPFIPLGADIQNGDALVTSGIDGTYPAGLAVATVIQVEKNPAFPFAKVVAQPATAPNHHRFVKVLLRAPAETAGSASASSASQSAYPQVDVGVGDKKSTSSSTAALKPAASGSSSARRDPRRNN